MVEVKSDTATEVSVKGRADTAKLGVNGVVLAVDSVGDTESDASLKVDYSSFEGAGGAGFGSRLRLVELPECAVETPDRAECQVQTPIVDSVNDPVTKTVSGTVSAAGSGVVALAAGAGGSQGDFTATSLGAVGSWNVGGPSGSFSWSYPVKIHPTASGGPAPTIDVAYDSTWMDGRIAGANNQGSWVGQGWEYSPGFIERTYRACADDPAGTSGTSYDLCWAGEIVTVSLNGSTSELVRDDTSGVWRWRADEGSKVEKLTGAPNGDNDGEYWRITTNDGVQYWFGRHTMPGSPNLVSNSTWTVPVYGAHAGEPCHQSTFAASRCNQAWRWNLDYVEDPHGNAMQIDYVKETNYYGANKGATRVQYDRGGYPTLIRYGRRNVNGTIYNTQATHRVSFAVMERCENTSTFTCSDSTFTAANAAKWPDTPVDQSCAATGTCSVYSPTFWSRKRLSMITTSYFDGTNWKTLDTYQFKSYYPTGGEPTQWLEWIQHVGYATDGSTLTMPLVRFYGVLKPNRVQGFNSMPGMLFWRMSSINDTGQTTTVTYTDTDCSASSVPSNPAANTRRCFPVKWTLPYQQNQTLDWFHKYVVTQVRVSDNSGLTRPHVTNYTYVGDPTWMADDNEVVKPATRSYGQWRGYRTVEVRTGDGQTSGNGATDAISLTKTTYYLGTGSTFTNSLGETITDKDEYSGASHETRTYTGNGGTVQTKNITDWTTVATTATRNRTGLPALKATHTRVAKNRELRLVGTTWEHITTQSTYDSSGRLVQTSGTGTGLEPVCTRTSYATNTGRNITAVANEIISEQECPAIGQSQTNILGETRYFFDGSTTLGAIPSVADATRAERRADGTRFTKATGTFDAMGRALTATVFTSADDTSGRTTRYTYTSGPGGQLASTTVTNALGQTSTTHVMPGRHVAIKEVSVTGAVTEVGYDALGRVSGVWEPGHTKGTHQASRTYSYTIRTSGGPQVVTTKTLVDSGPVKTYRTVTALSDALGRALQTQTETEPGNRIVADSAYDSLGQVVKSNNRWATTGIPTTTLITTSDSNVDDRDVIFYDGMGRTTRAEKWRGSTKSWETRYAYGGDRTTVVGPTGSTPTTTITNVAGLTTQVLHYTTPPTLSGNTVTGGSHKSTSFTYDSLARQKSFTAIDGTIFTMGYDFLGRNTTITDPDTGTSTWVYNDLDEVLMAKDSRGQKTHYTYDVLGRVTETRVGSDKKLLTENVYDTVKTGLPTSTTSYSPAGSSNAYTSAVTDYNVLGQPTGTKVTIPAAEGALAGTYTFGATYTSTGDQLTATQPAIGGLPAETLATTYSKFGHALTLKGANEYAVQTSYTDADELSQIVLKQNSTAAMSWWRDDQTRRLTRSAFTTMDVVSPSKTDLTYSYDPSGNITKTVETRGKTTDFQRTTCYSHGAFQQMTAAWTATDDCATAPTAGSSSMVGGPVPFWTAWEYNTAGNRTVQTRHVTPVGEPDTTTYAYTDTNHPHALTSHTATHIGTGAAATTTYSHDSHGNTTSATSGTAVTQFTWNQDNRADTVTNPAGSVTTYVYDGSGTQLLRKTPATSTLYLPGGNELTLTIGTGAVVGTRSYTHAGVLVATRNGSSTPIVTFTDHNGTPITTLPWASYTPTYRTFDPFGNNQDPTPPLWSTSRGFLNSPTTENGYNDVGARTYNPTTGTFLTPDPILAPGDPLSPSTYTYGNNNPTTTPDPTGMRPDDYTMEMYAAENRALGWGYSAVEAIEYAYSTPSGKAGGHSWMNRYGQAEALLTRNGGFGYEGARSNYLASLKSYRESAGLSSPNYFAPDYNDVHNWRHGDYTGLIIAGGVILVGAVVLLAIFAPWTLVSLVGGVVDTFAGSATAAFYPAMAGAGIALTSRLGAGAAKPAATGASQGLKTAASQGTKTGTTGATKTAPGVWGTAAESMSRRAAAYQAQITGRTAGSVYRVGGVKFDGFANGVLQEAKGPGYAQFVKNGQFQPWFNGADGLVAQAERQLAAAGGTPITWSVAEASAASAINRLFVDRGISGINVVHVPVR